MHSIDQGVGDTYLIAGELECARKYDGGAEFRTGLFGVINLSAPYLTGWHDLQIRNVGKLRQLSREYFGDAFRIQTLVTAAPD